MSEEIGVNAITAISKRLILPGVVEQVYLPSFFPRLTEAQRRELREQREAEWDEKKALGMVPLTEGGDHCYECGGTTEWLVVEVRGQHVSKWVPADKWGVYRFARHLMEVAEEGIDEAQ